MYTVESSGYLSRYTTTEKGNILRSVRPYKTVTIEDSDISIVDPSRYLNEVIEKQSKPLEMKAGKYYFKNDDPNVYQLVKKLDLSGKSTYIFRQVSGSREGYIYLDKEECEIFNIPFEQNLVSFPEFYKYHEVEETEIDGFKESDLSTLPKVKFRFGDDNIKEVFILELSGFVPREDPGLIQYKNILIDLESFLCTLKVKLKTGIAGYNGSAEFFKGQDLEWGISPSKRYIAESIKLSDQHIVDNNGNIHLFLNMTKNKIPVSKLSLTGKSIRDLVRVTFNAAYSINKGSIDSSESEEQVARSYPDRSVIFHRLDDIYWRKVDVSFHKNINV